MYTYTVLCSSGMVLCSGPSGYSVVPGHLENANCAMLIATARDDITYHARVHLCLTCMISSFATHKEVRSHEALLIVYYNQ